MVETHGQTEGRTVRKFIRSISTFFFANSSAVVVKHATRTPGVHSSSSSPTNLRKLHKNKLPTGASSHSTVSTPLHPDGTISRARSCDLRCPDPLAAGAGTLHRSESDTATASTRRPPSPTHFQSCSHTARDHLRGGCGCEEPVVPAMSCREAWKVIGRRFQRASRHELLPARRQLGAFEISARRQAVACDVDHATARRHGGH